ncbi:MAG: hypothetical protein KC944_14115, partial [Candidatus Omnitrophica bacterium]|nr:hypothetical protein [Candidatus Omnitrophota bacterium]
REYPIEVWPDTTSLESVDGTDLVVFDPGGELSLDRLGINGRTIHKGPTLTAPATDQILIIGPSAEIDDQERSRLLQFVREGGRALVLEGNPEALPPYAGSYELGYSDLPGSWFAYLNGSHPITQSLDEADLRDWGTDSSLLTGWTRDLAMGNARTPIVSGCGGAVLIDLPIGMGRMIVSHLKLGEKSRTHPIALQLLARALDDLGSSIPSPLDAAAYHGPQGSDLEHLLNGLGVVTNPEGDEIVLIDGSDSDWLDTIGKPFLSGLLQSETDQARTVVVWGLNQEGADLLGSLLPESIQIEAADHSFLVPQGELMDGVYPETTYWIEGYLTARSVIEAGMVVDGSPTDREDFLVAPDFDWRGLVFEAETTRTSAILRSQRENPPTPLSGLSSYEIGNTRIVLCWLRTEMSPKNLALVSTFLTNLGVEIDPFRPTPDLHPDGTIDWKDLFVFSNGWLEPIGQSPETSRSDFSRDGTVNSPDLVEFLNFWETPTNEPFEKDQLKADGPNRPNSKAEIYSERNLLH